MSLRFQADADLHPRIREGVLRIEPTIDYRVAQGFILDGLPDLEVLRLAAKDGRVLVSKDVNTMLASWFPFIAEHESPGLILIPSSRSMVEIVEGLVMAWSSWEENELRNQFRWLPRVDQ